LNAVGKSLDRKNILGGHLVTKPAKQHADVHVDWHLRHAA
jgi:hypothetical protein